MASQTLIQEQLAASAGWFAGRDPSSFDPARLRLRVLIGAGSVDPLIPVANDRYLARRMRRAKLLAYPGAAHGFLFQRQTSFVGHVQRFLR